ncbi:sigma-70 family RNA polymerase sigma factor [Nonomuraea fuscirosea]|uniref:sigma-70 family RNA polymerase sigma factor n=1 Tax=Nonomuraea fuscirosea TaxID=1291556 RepID=UPI002DDBC06F|nr:sigma-70 family RNA polymerase sigma factor [Nonomuraea fuscirosea]WSA54541.1 sigma-70 family RNA polymerase sigma factor [Nonomuraea fuscirosea]
MARLHISAWRRIKRERLVVSIPEEGSADADIARFDGEPGLWRLVTRLPPRRRAVIVLCHYCDLSDEEIAEALGVSRGTVRSQAARALDKLKAAWDHPARPGRWNGPVARCVLSLVRVRSSRASRSAGSASRPGHVRTAGREGT